MSRRLPGRDAPSRVRISTVVADPNDYYAKLIINSGRRRFLYLSLILCFTGIFLLVSLHMRAPYSWKLMCLPIITCGLAMLLVPRTEKWSYRPWQGAPRLYEKHIFKPR